MYLFFSCIECRVGRIPPIELGIDWNEDMVGYEFTQQATGGHNSNVRFRIKTEREREQCVGAY